MSISQMSPAKYGIIALACVTAVIHFFLGNLLFILNGVGYLILLALFILPPFTPWREPARWVMVAYAGFTIAAYFFVHRDGSWQMDGLGVLTKVIEIILVLALIYDFQNSEDPEQHQSS